MLREELLRFNLPIIISWQVFFWFEASLRENVGDGFWKHDHHCTYWYPCVQNSTSLYLGYLVLKVGGVGGVKDALYVV